MSVSVDPTVLSKLFLLLLGIVLVLLSKSGRGYNLIKALFVASVIFCIHHKFPSILKPFDDMSVAFVNVFARQEQISENYDIDQSVFLITSESKDEHDRNQENIYVMVITPKEYNRDFLGISPLDRCTLAEKLKRVFSNHPKTLAIDLDLSPVCSPKENIVTRYYNNCQKEIDSLLISHSKTTKIILIDPEEFQKTISECIVRWKEKLKKEGILFASPKIMLSLGVSLYYPINTPTLGKLAVQSIENANNHSEHEVSETDHHEKEAIPINFLVRIEKLTPKDIEPGSIIFFGGGFNPLDSFDTPIGKTPGVLVHALGAFSIKHPPKESETLAYSLDVAVAIITFIIVNSLLTYKLNSEKRIEPFLGLRSCIRVLISNNIQFLILITVFLIIVFSLILNVYLYRTHNVLFSPIPIILGVLFDGLFGIILENLEEKSRNIENNHKLLQNTTKYMALYTSIKESIKKLTTEKIHYPIKFCIASMMLFFIVYSPFMIAHQYLLGILYFISSICLFIKGLQENYHLKTR